MFDIPTPHHPGELVVPRYAGVVMPRVRSRVDPHFDTRDKKGSGLGWVSLYLVIGTDGRPADVEILHSSMPSAFAAEVVRAVSQWRYYPATRDGKPVTVMSTVRWTVNM
jgi:protein TonB